MTFTLSNLKPIVFKEPSTRTSPEFFNELLEGFDDNPTNKINLADPIDITYNDSVSVQSLTKQDLVESMHTMYDADMLDPDLARNMATLTKQAALKLDDYNNVDQLLANQNLSNFKLPYPSPRIIYTFKADIIDELKTLAYNKQPNDTVLSRHTTKDFDFLIASFGGVMISNDIEAKVLPFFVDSETYQKLTTNVTNVMATLPADEINIASQILQRFSKPDILETLLIGLDQTSVLRQTILDTLSAYPHVPSSINQLLYTSTITLIDIDKTSSLSSSDWDDWVFNLKKHTLSNRSKSANRTFKQIQSMASNTANSQRQKFNRTHQSQQDVRRAVNKAKPMTKTLAPKELAKWITTKVSRHKTTGISKNTYKTTRRSFNKSNRRYPDNINIPGNVMKTQYRPTIHLYLDTSGSISESQFKSFVILLMRISKAFGFEFAFTTFSHYITPAYTMSNIQSKSTAQLYAEFSRVPKASGGTEFQNVYDRIKQRNILNMKNGRSQEINFIISDFDYRFHATSDKLGDISSTYYIPIDGTQYTMEDMFNYFKQLSLITTKNLRSHFAAK